MYLLFIIYHSCLWLDFDVIYFSPFLGANKVIIIIIIINHIQHIKCIMFHADWYFEGIKKYINRQKICNRPTWKVSAVLTTHSYCGIWCTGLKHEWHITDHYMPLYWTQRIIFRWYSIKLQNKEWNIYYRRQTRNSI